MGSAWRSPAWRSVHRYRARPLTGIILVRELTGGFDLPLTTTLSCATASLTAAWLGGEPLHEQPLARTHGASRATEPADRGELKREGPLRPAPRPARKASGSAVQTSQFGAGVPLHEQEGVNVLRDLARIYGPAALLVALGLLVAYHFLPPAPPLHLVMATSSRDEPYYAYGLRYRDELAREGITLELRETAGAVENLRLLQDPSAGVDVAFTQGGIAPGEGGAKVRAIASVFLEPLWLFTRKPIMPDQLARRLRPRRQMIELLAINGMSAVTT